MENKKQKQHSTLLMAAKVLFGATWSLSSTFVCRRKCRWVREHRIVETQIRISNSLVPGTLPHFSFGGFDPKTECRVCSCRSVSSEQQKEEVKTLIVCCLPLSFHSPHFIIFPVSIRQQWTPLPTTHPCLLAESASGRQSTPTSSLDTQPLEGQPHTLACCTKRW